MNIYIGMTHDNKPLGVLLAESKDKANLAWSMLDGPCHHVEEIDPQTIDSLHGVIFLLTSSPIINSNHRKGRRGKI